MSLSYSEKEEQLKRRTKQPSQKDLLIKTVHPIFERSRSLKQFETLLSQADIKTYSYRGKLTGCYYGKRKYRFKRSLGIDPELLMLKDKAMERMRSLGQVVDEREQGRSKGNDIEP
ncbi:hypothetical protein L0P88_13815 [Muricauda sp. SCSIO 64092]|uniref:hypothetical protein n=1 Tax=Allomuricauda sp. SCSIO 64092 TaxID=2908842 RepID=UPI001FF25F80|nr:hypothetical protein [Muricauda sp. SCSIO 64092]UOY05029.1 hypothetical protein L0P88_13815 [Muricauda sp. SCSIO 64092]